MEPMQGAKSFKKSKIFMATIFQYEVTIEFVASAADRRKGTTKAAKANDVTIRRRLESRKRPPLRALIDNVLSSSRVFWAG